MQLHTQPHCLSNSQRYPVPASVFHKLPFPCPAVVFPDNIIDEITSIGQGPCWSDPSNESAALQSNSAKLKLVAQTSSKTVAALSMISDVLSVYALGSSFGASFLEPPATIQ